MPIPRRLSALVATVFTAALAVTVLVTGVVSPAQSVSVGAPDARAVAAPALAEAGAAGIGDPYWPLDGNGGIDVLRYRITNDYRPSTQVLKGQTTLTLRATADLRSFNLDFLLPVSSVRVNGEPASFTRPSGHELTITPVSSLTSGSLATVTVAYAGRPSRHRYAKESNWLTSGSEALAINQPHMAPWWFPSNDHPRDKALFTITTTVPRPLQVISNGRLVRKSVAKRTATWTWRSREPMATYLAFIAVGEYVVQRGTFEGRPWLVAVARKLTPATQRRNLRDLRRTPQIVAWLEDQLGPYPFAETGGIVSGLGAGFALENQTRPVYPALSAHVTELMVHELAHQWFGNSVSLQAWQDIWLNEGSATFMEWWWIEAHGGQPVVWRLRDTYDASGPADQFWTLPIGDPGRGEVFNNAVYDRGAMTFAALRTRIGAVDFSTLLRRWLADHRYGNATGAEFRALAEQVSGEDLDGFFRAWLDTPGKPALTADNGLLPAA